MRAATEHLRACLRAWDGVRTRAIAAAALALLLPLPTLADEAADAEARSTPIKPGLVYNGAAFASLAGGARPGATFTSNLQAHVDLDLEKLLGWRDTIAYADVLWLQGGLPSSFVGDAQGVSSISASNAVRMYEAWIQRNLLDGHVSVLAGQYDLNSEFYRLQTAGLFLNSSFGIGPEFSQSGEEGPSVFPATAVGMRVAFKSDDGVVVRVAVLDGVPVARPNGSRRAFAAGDGALLVAEVDLLDRPPPAQRSSRNRLRIGRDAMLPSYERKLALGAWYYTAEFDDLSETQANGQPVAHRGSSGIYLLGDQVLQVDPENKDRTLAAFLQFGVGDARTDRFGSYLGAGVVASGISTARPGDQLGLAIAYARNGSHYIRSQQMQGLPVTRAETAFELTYLVQINTWLALQPDLQYVVSPNTSAIPNALAFQLRIAASLD